MGPGTGLPSVSFASDEALTARETVPSPGNVAVNPGGVRSCKLPVSSKSVNPAGRSAGGGKTPAAGWVGRVEKNPTAAPPATKLDSVRTSLTPPPPGADKAARLAELRAAGEKREVIFD